MQRFSIQLPEPLVDQLSELFLTYGGPNRAFDNRRTFNQFLVTALADWNRRERRRQKHFRRKYERELEEERQRKAREEAERDG